MRRYVLTALLTAAAVTGAAYDLNHVPLSQWYIDGLHLGVDSTLTGTWTATVGSPTIVRASGSAAIETELAVGDSILIGGYGYAVTARADGAADADTITIKPTIDPATNARRLGATATVTGQPVYKINIGADSALRTLYDGGGTATPLSLSTSGLGITGNDNNNLWEGLALYNSDHPASGETAQGISIVGYLSATTDGGSTWYYEPAGWCGWAKNSDYFDDAAPWTEDDNDGAFECVNVNNGSLDASFALSGQAFVVTGATVKAMTSLEVGGAYSGGSGATVSSAGVVQANGAITTDGTLTAADASIGGGAGSSGVTISSAGAITADAAATVQIDGNGAADVEYLCIKDTDVSTNRVASTSSSAITWDWYSDTAAGAWTTPVLKEAGRIEVIAADDWEDDAGAYAAADSLMKLSVARNGGMESLLSLSYGQMLWQSSGEIVFSGAAMRFSGAMSNASTTAGYVALGNDGFFIEGDTTDTNELKITWPSYTDTTDGDMDGSTLPAAEFLVSQPGSAWYNDSTLTNGQSGFRYKVSGDVAAALDADGAIFTSAFTDSASANLTGSIVSITRGNTLDAGGGDAQRSLEITVPDASGAVSTGAGNAIYIADARAGVENDALAEASLYISTAGTHSVYASARISTGAGALAAGASITEGADGALQTYSWQGTITYGDLSAEATSADVALVTLPAKTIVQYVVCDTTTAATYTGGAADTLVLSIGDTGAGYEDWLADWDGKSDLLVGDAPAERGDDLDCNDETDMCQAAYLPSYTATTAVNIHAATDSATGLHLDDLNAGEWVCSLVYTVLP